jgi:hypothetical protein
MEKADLPLVYVDEHDNKFVMYNGVEHQVEFIALISPSHVIFPEATSGQNTTKPAAGN